MKRAYPISDNIITSLGFSTAENLISLEKMKSGLILVSASNKFNSSFYGSLISDEEIRNRFELLAHQDRYTRFEQLCILSVSDALKSVDINFRTEETLLILSTTKGNIDLLDRSKQTAIPYERVFLWKTAEIIKDFFGLKNSPLVISNACISGVLALIVGARLIEKEKYKHVIVAGADILTEFVVSGFQSFKSLSTTPCKPFDKDRDGLSLGEAAGTVILSSDPDKNKIFIAGGASSNDANHISGPSRTGEGLYLSMKSAMNEAQNKISGNIGFISTHGTATPYNDEMETIAFNRMGFSEIPLVGLKGFWGHTLGAAGLIESVAAYQSMNQGIVHGTAGFENAGVSVPVIINKEISYIKTDSCLKVASGFGGCNAALVFSKE